MIRKKRSDALLVLVTCPSRTEARKIARAVLSERLVACVNMVPGIESHYWWSGKLEKAGEILLLMKTTRTRLPSLRSKVLEVHPYDVPEFVAIRIDHGSPAYLEWIAHETAARSQPPLKPRRTQDDN